MGKLQEKITATGTTEIREEQRVVIGAGRFHGAAVFQELSEGGKKKAGQTYCKHVGGK